MEYIFLLFYCTILQSLDKPHRFIYNGGKKGEMTVTTTLSALLHTDCTVMELTGVYITAQAASEYDYSKLGRHKHMIYYCEKGTRHYFDAKNRPLLTIHGGDAVFAADGANYISRIEDGDAPESGIVISFQLQTPEGEPIEITDTFRLLARDRDRHLYRKIMRLYEKILQNGHRLGIKAAFYDLLSDLLTHDADAAQRYSEELAPAIAFMEAHPERQVRVGELAAMCHMSESSFAHKFSKYSNGISPLQFRNRIRMMKAEEMANDANLSVESIAQHLGFYDAGYLCRSYKKHTGKTLKRQRGERT